MTSTRDWAAALRQQIHEERPCKQCGETFTAHWPPQWVCSDCARRHYLLTSQQLRDLRAEDERRQLERLGLNGRLAAMTWEEFDTSAQPEAVTLAAQVLAEWPESASLALLGPPGTGKTHLAVALLLKLRERGVRGRYVHVPSLVTQLRRAVDRADAETRLLEPLFQVPLLVLDDVGREKATDHWQQWIDVLMNDRWVAGRPIVVTANLTLDELEAWLGEASASRVMSHFESVWMDGDDQRQIPRPRVVGRAVGNPAVACTACNGAGWVLDDRVQVGHADRLMSCPTCSGRGW